LETINVKTAVPFQEQATDPDDDGDRKYENVNGDGTGTIAEVQALFANLDKASSNPRQFDRNGDCESPSSICRPSFQIQQIYRLICVSCNKSPVTENPVTVASSFDRT
jgi:hypothetical protein